MIQAQWPNKLGYDILDTNGLEIGEVWQSRLDGKWGIRTFGDTWKSLLIDPSEHLFMSPIMAVELCRAHGEIIQ